MLYCLTLVYCRPFHSKELFWAIWKDFEFAVSCSSEAKERQYFKFYFINFADKKQQQQQQQQNVHIFTGVQAGILQRRAPITAGPTHRSLKKKIKNCNTNLKTTGDVR